MSVLAMQRMRVSELRAKTLGDLLGDNEEAVLEAYRLLDREDEHQDEGEAVMQALLVWFLSEADELLDTLTWNEDARKDFANWATGWIEARERKTGEGAA